MLISYVRDKNRQPFATIVAINKQGIGLAVCNDKDRFCKKRGIQIAKGRAEMYTDHNGNLPIDLVGIKGKMVQKEIEKMRVRAEKYFVNPPA